MLQLEVAKLLEAHKTFAIDNATRMDSLQIKLDRLHERHETLLKEHIADRRRHRKKRLHITAALNCRQTESNSLQITNASVIVELVPFRVLNDSLRVSNITLQQSIDVDDLRTKFEKLSISDGVVV